MYLSKKQLAGLRKFYQVNSIFISIPDFKKDKVTVRGIIKNYLDTQV